jgi:hypothetical protein
MKITPFRGYYPGGIQNTFDPSLYKNTYYMPKSSRRRRLRNLAILLLLLTGGAATAQTADQQLKAIPDNIKTDAASKATTKSNTVTNNAMNKLDSASNKAFNGITHMFKKKKKPPVDSTKTHPADTAAVPAKPTGMIRKRSSADLAETISLFPNIENHKHETCISRPDPRAACSRYSPLLRRSAPEEPGEQYDEKHRQQGDHDLRQSGQRQEIADGL